MNIRYKIFDRLIELKAGIYADDLRHKSCLDGLFAFTDDNLAFEVKVFRNWTTAEVVAIRHADGRIEKPSNSNLDLNMIFYRRLERYLEGTRPPCYKD